jgi:hypothetical protein
MAAQYTVGESLPNGGTVVSDTYVTNPDGSTVETMVDSFGDQVRIFTPGPGTPAANQQTIATKVSTWPIANVAYLAVAVPSVAQTTAQLNALTKAVNALIYLVTGNFGSTAGT